MNRIEIVGLFTAMDAMIKDKNYAALERTITAVLDEAVTKKGDGKGGKAEEKEWEQ